ncbi:hypothetical protein M427DRAFT_134335 [Gonapodya prolifera JEL478]|uniref:Uncharacterized protein n=1 Tax=Gonapodya prolifera (strain JEL478) TaxID=1344416 RepID=A0A139AHZ1_GONPJ|nr:hypothetical protein M427DRAFT_134335 [Gonapodya prolifera JEL478]|eukprot:KXS16309.1 hypothetical protein M427DRAFT_134335 [Gonapodya prolifera JEL478]
MTLGESKVRVQLPSSNDFDRLLSILSRNPTAQLLGIYKLQDYVLEGEHGELGEQGVSFTFRYVTRTFPVLPTYDIGDEDAEFVLGLLDPQGQSGVTADTSLMHLRESTESINPDDPEIRLILRESPLKPGWTAEDRNGNGRDRERGLGYGNAKSKLVKRVLVKYAVGDGMKCVGNFHTFRHTFSLLVTPVDTPSASESISSPLRSLVHLDRCQIAHNEPLGWFVTVMGAVGDGEGSEEGDDNGPQESGERVRFLLSTSRLTSHPNPVPPTVLFTQYATRWNEGEEEREQQEAERRDRIVREVAKDVEAREAAKRVGLAAGPDGPVFRRDDSQLDPLARDSARRLFDADEAAAYDAVAKAFRGSVGGVDGRESESGEADDGETTSRGGGEGGGGKKGSL